MDTELLSPHVAWVLIAAFLVAVMQAGFTCLESGFVRAKNSIHVAVKNLMDFCISSLLFTLFGFGIMFGPSYGGIIGLPTLATYENLSPHDISFFIFQIMFCGTAATIISGAVSERMRFVGYIFVTVVIAGLIYPIVGHWVWNGAHIGQTNGWLGKLGFVDFAGSTVVHGVGGWIALSAILVIGPRIGRFGEHGHRIEGHNLPMAVLGVFLLLFGFFGFNGGSTLAINNHVPLIIANTALAGALGGLGGISFSWLVNKHPTVEGIVNGTVSGLVASCAGAHLIGSIDAMIIGFIAGVLALWGMMGLEKWEIDDVIGAVPAHLFAGAWGTVAVALFVAPDQLPTGNTWSQLGVQLLGVGVIGLFSMPCSYLIFRLADKFIPFRVTPEAERLGLNIAEHNASSSLLDLISQMDFQARTGKFDRNVEVEPETEASEIATFYNAVLHKVRTETHRRQEAMNQLTKLASTDALTGLPNRRSFFDNVHRALSASQRNLRQGAILFMDLDGFKAVNDRMGHEAGDALLKMVAHRLSDVVRDNDLPARLGGDEFALLVNELESLEGLKILANRLIETLCDRFELPQGNADIGASIGIAVFGGTKAMKEQPEEVIHRADEAMYKAKLAGKGTWRLNEAPVA
ncbi:ammonium transporter [Terasakiella pusilla]|uniref:ammonium transporter n=1 Tax=Terasakiella pusilla TaxID=64973 RepID=UPI003AA9130C